MTTYSNRFAAWRQQQAPAEAAPAPSVDPLDAFVREADEAEKSAIRKENTESMGEFRRGLNRGIEGVKASSHAARALFNQATGDEADRDEAYADYQAAEVRASLYPATVESFTEIGDHNGWLSDTADYVVSSLGELAPTMAEAALGSAMGAGLGSVVPGAGTAAGGVTGFLGRQAVKKAAVSFIEQQVKKGLTKEAAAELAEKVFTAESKKLIQKQAVRSAGAKAGMVGATWQMETGGNYGEAVDAVGFEDADISAAMATGLASASLEVLGGQARVIDRILGPESGTLFRKALESRDLPWVGRIAKEALTQAPQEFAQEAGQEFMAAVNLALNDAGPGLISPETGMRLAEAGMKGAVGGAASGGMTGAFSPRRADHGKRVAVQSPPVAPAEIPVQRGMAPAAEPPGPLSRAVNTAAAPGIDWAAELGGEGGMAPSVLPVHSDIERGGVIENDRKRLSENGYSVDPTMQQETEPGGNQDDVSEMLAPGVQARQDVPAVRDEDAEVKPASPLAAQRAEFMAQADQQRTQYLAAPQRDGKSGFEKVEALLQRPEQERRVSGPDGGKRLPDNTLITAAEVDYLTFLEGQRGLKPGVEVPVEQRRDLARRKTIAQMSPEEMRRELLVSPLTGLQNRRAYDESERQPVQASIDLDGLKWINDNMGHQYGDELIAAMGKAVAKETEAGYHFSGDEFVIEGADAATMAETIAKIQTRLSGVVFEYTDATGNITRKQGVEFGYGLGPDLATAEEALKRAKSNSPTRRGAEPAGVARVPAGGRETANHSAAGPVAEPTAAAPPKTTYPRLKQQAAKAGLTLSAKQADGSFAIGNRAGKLLKQSDNLEDIRTFIATHLAKERKQVRRRIEPQSDDLLLAVRKLGGLDRGQVLAQWGSGVTESPTVQRQALVGLPVVRKEKGLSLDRMLEALKGHGYFGEDADLRTFEEAFMRAAGGELVMADAGSEAQAQAYYERETARRAEEMAAAQALEVAREIDPEFAGLIEHEPELEGISTEALEWAADVFNDIAEGGSLMTAADYLHSLMEESDDEGRYARRAPQEIRGPAEGAAAEGAGPGGEGPAPQTGILTEPTAAGEQVKLFATPPTFGKKAQTGEAVQSLDFEPAEAEAGLFDGEEADRVAGAGEPMKTDQRRDRVRAFKEKYGYAEPKSEKDAAENPAAAVKENLTAQPPANTVFTEDAYQKAKALLKQKLASELRSGIDPELMQAGFTIAGYHIERGARKFSAYATAMIEDFGEAIRPYLKAFYNGVRDLPGIDSITAEMDGYEAVRAADVETLPEETPAKKSLLDEALAGATPLSEADKLRKQADALMKESQKILEGIEPGQPVLSSRDRNRREKAGDKARQAAALYDQAEKSAQGSPLSFVPEDLDRQKAMAGYAHTSHTPGHAATVEQSDYVAFMEGLRDRVLEVVPNTNITSLNSELEQIKDDYLARRYRVLSSRSSTVSSFIAGRNNFNKKQADQRGNSVDRAEDDFSQWKNRATAQVFETTGVAEALRQQKKAEAERSAAARVEIDRREKEAKKKQNTLPIINEPEDAEPITREQWGKTPSDYKSVLVSADGTYRYRSKIINGALTPIFITDMAVKRRPGAEEAQEDAAEESATIKEKEENHVLDQRGNTDLERDRANAAPADGLGEEGVSSGPGSDGAAGERRVRSAAGAKRTARGSRRLSRLEAAAAGERGDFSPYHEDEQPATAQRSAGSDDGGGSGAAGLDGIPPDHLPAETIDAASQGGVKLISRRQAQKQVQSVPIVPADKANIDQTLPFLHGGQRADVLFAEQRFAKPEGYGVLFTNGTGTGKTYSGLGVVKRFERQGKTNILIVVPDAKVQNDWIVAGKNLALDLFALADTKDGGKGIVIATYANLGQNDALASRPWDLVVADESHNLMQAKDAAETQALEALRAISSHPLGKFRKHAMLHREEIAELDRATEKLTAFRKLLKKGEPTDRRQQAVIENLEEKIADIQASLNRSRDVVYADIDAAQGAERTRVVFLSATPFAYEKTVDYAAGYLFDYPAAGYIGNSRQGGFEKFMVEHFGYRIRYHKLNEPGPEVNRGLMQRQFNSWLKKEKVLAGRMLDVDQDYDRKFVLTENAIGAKIDEGLQFLWENKRFQPLWEKVQEKFDHLSRRYLLEALKAREAIPLVREHLALGRKIVVFHDYKKGGGFNPFDLAEFRESDDEITLRETKEKTTIGTLVREFEAQRPDLARMDLRSLVSPIAAFQGAFPDVLVVNGDRNGKENLAAYDRFNDDASGPQVLLVQSAKNAGWSGHDTTGRHQRVLFNLGLPTRPTMAIQQEGRIYRVGQQSNALFRYLNTGTNWERFAFATTIAHRSSAAENLALGEEARALMDAFIQAFEESDTYPAGHAGEGTGGKERDRAANAALSEWDRATTLYFAQHKKTSRTKALEGTDYFATPEPLGLKMVEWAGIRDGETALEPSAGHGAIARWLPENIARTVIEPSAELASRLKMVTDAKLLQEDFEDFHIVNKFDAVVMNPPFGKGGKTAVEHLDKATRHLRDGGRVVALLPTGPAADKAFDQWFYAEDEKGKILLPDLHLAAEVRLPAATFERAGTKVATRIVVIDKLEDGTRALPQASRDYSSAQSVKELFELIEDAQLRRPEALDREEEAVPAAGTAGAAGMIEGGGFRLAQTTHAKKGIELFVATATERLEREDFDALRQMAKKHGGYWSSYRAQGAIPGFQFESEQDRADFVAEATAEQGDPPKFAARKEKSVPGALGDVEFDAIFERITGRVKDAERLANGFVVVRRGRDLPPRIVAEIEKQGNRPDEIDGVFHDGKVYLVRENITSAARLEEVLFHEWHGHAGLSAMMGGDLKRAMVELYDMFPAGSLLAIAKKYKINLVRYAQGLRKAGYDDDTRHATLMEELLTHLTEEYSGQDKIAHKIREIVGRVRAWLRKNGFAHLAEWGETDIAFLLKRARTYAEAGAWVKDGEPVAVNGKEILQRLRAAGIADELLQKFLTGTPQFAAGERQDQTQSEGSFDPKNPDTRFSITPAAVKAFSHKLTPDKDGLLYAILKGTILPERMKTAIGAGLSNPHYSSKKSRWKSAAYALGLERGANDNEIKYEIMASKGDYAGLDGVRDAWRQMSKDEQKQVITLINEGDIRKEEYSKDDLAAGKTPLGKPVAEVVSMCYLAIRQTVKHGTEVMFDRLGRLRLLPYEGSEYYDELIDLLDEDSSIEEVRRRFGIEEKAVEAYLKIRKDDAKLDKLLRPYKEQAWSSTLKSLLVAGKSSIEVQNEHGKTPDLVQAFQKIKRKEPVSITTAEQFKTAAWFKTLQELLRQGDEHPMLQKLELFNAYQGVQEYDSQLAKLKEEWGRVKGYFPRIRKDGEQHVKVFRVDPEDGTFTEVWMQPAKTVYGAEQLRAQVEANLAEYIPRSFDAAATYEVVVEPNTATPEEIFMGLGSHRAIEGLLSKVFDKATDAGILENAMEVQSQVLRILADEISARGFGRHRLQRAEHLIEGYETENTPAILAQFVGGMAGWLSKSEFAMRANKLMGEIPQTRPDDKSWVREYVDDALKNSTWLDQWFGTARSFAALMFLGFKASSALLNATQNYVWGQAQLSKHTRGATAKLLKAQADVVRDHLLLKAGKAGILTDEERWVLEEGLRRGRSHANYVRAMAGMDDNGGVLDKGQAGIRWLTEKAMVPFQAVETYWNREPALIAAYRVFRGKGMTKEAALKQAETFVDDVHFVIGKENIPALLRKMGPVGRTLYTFQSYTHNYLLGMLTSLKKGEFEVVARSLTALVLFGGLAALPFGDDLDQWYRRIFGERPLRMLERWLRETANQYVDFGDQVADFVLHGAPALAGVNFSNSLAVRVPWFSPQDDSLAERVTGVWGGLAQKVRFGAVAAGRGDALRAAEYMSPEALANILRAYRHYADGATTMSGRPVFGDDGRQVKYTAGEGIIRTFGFMPLRPSKQSQARWDARLAKQYWSDRKGDVLARFRGAGTAAERKAAMQRVRDFNRELREAPGGVLVPPITMQSLRQAVKARPDKRELAYQR